MKLNPDSAVFVPSGQVCRFINIDNVLAEFAKIASDNFAIILHRLRIWRKIHPSTWNGIMNRNGKFLVSYNGSKKLYNIHDDILNEILGKYSAVFKLFKTTAETALTNSGKEYDKIEYDKYLLYKQFKMIIEYTDKQYINNWLDSSLTNDIFVKYNRDKAGFTAYVLELIAKYHNCIVNIIIDFANTANVGGGDVGGRVDSGSILYEHVFVTLDSEISMNPIERPYNKEDFELDLKYMGYQYEALMLQVRDNRIKINDPTNNKAYSIMIGDVDVSGGNDGGSNNVSGSIDSDDVSVNGDDINNGDQCNDNSNNNVPNIIKVSSEEIELRERWIEKIRAEVLKHKDSLHRVVFIDADNAISAQKFILEQHNPDDAELFITFGQFARLRSVRSYVDEHPSVIEKVFYIANILNTKDAADIDFAREVYWYHEHLPRDIDFLFLSHDGFVYELAASIVLRRNVLVFKWAPDKFVRYIEKVIEPHVGINGVVNTTVEYKESRMTKFLKNSNLCNKIAQNGLPCRNPRWCSCDICYDHFE